MSGLALCALLPGECESDVSHFFVLASVSSGFHGFFCSPFQNVKLKIHVMGSGSRSNLIDFDVTRRIFGSHFFFPHRFTASIQDAVPVALTSND